jgi:carbamoyl-phosphate synthase large subunit
VFELTNIDPWFLTNLAEIVSTEKWIASQKLSALTKEDFHEIKKMGFSDSQVREISRAYLLYM